MHSELEPWLERFERLVGQSPGPVPWSVQVHPTEAARGPHSAPPAHLVVGSCIHGIETGSLPAVVTLLEEVLEGAVGCGSTLTVFLGNPDAVRKGVRFVEADLNRVFGHDSPESLESRRAAELKPLLESASVFFDFHQTLQPSVTPFYIFGWHEESYLWARLVGGSTVLVTRDGRQAFATGSLCGDEYCRARGIPAVTLELGECGIRPEATRLCYTALRALIDWSVVLRHDSQSLDAAATARPEFTFYETIHREPFVDGAQCLSPGLHNFRAVKQGDILGDCLGRPIAAARDGLLLFPKYPRRDIAGRCIDLVAGDLYHVASPMESHPREIWRR
jgi:succinylglutamate desuccinylase